MVNLEKIKAADKAVDKAMGELFACVVEAFPVGMSVNAAGVRGPIECTVSGHSEPDVLQLTVKKSGKTMSRCWKAIDVE